MRLRNAITCRGVSRGRKWFSWFREGVIHNTRRTWNKLIMFWSYTNDTLSNGRRTPVVVFYLVHVGYGRFDLIMMLPKIELNILFIHHITYVLIYHTILATLHLVPCLPRTTVMLLDVISCTKLHTHVFPYLTIAIVSNTGCAVKTELITVTFVNRKVLSTYVKNTWDTPLNREFTQLFNGRSHVFFTCVRRELAFVDCLQPSQSDVVASCNSQSYMVTFYLKDVTAVLWNKFSLNRAPCTGTVLSAKF